MRKIFLLRGVPGSGKSSFIARHHLLPYAISRDAIRLLLSDLTVYYEAPTDELHQVIPRYVTEETDQTLINLVTRKMSRGETIIVDGTHIFVDQIKAYEDLVRKYRYELFVVDFMKHAQLPALLKRNRTRMHYDWVKPDVIETMFHEYESKKKLPSWAKVIGPKAIRYALSQKEKDLSKYQHVTCVPDQVAAADFPPVNLANFYFSFNDAFSEKYGSYKNVINLAKTPAEAVEDFKLPFFVFKFHHKHFLISAYPIRNEMLDPIRKDKGVWTYSTGLYNVADFVQSFPPSAKPHVHQFNLCNLDATRLLHIW
jgi:predicted kinase